MQGHQTASSDTTRARSRSSYGEVHILKSALVSFPIKLTRFLLNLRYALTIDIDVYVYLCLCVCVFVCELVFVFVCVCLDFLLLA